MAIRSRKLASGKTVYDVTVKHASGREYATAGSLAEARAIEVALKAQHGPSNARRKAQTLEEYIYAVYWPIASQRLSATTLDTYEKEIRLRIAPALGDMKLIEIDRAAIQSLMVDGCPTASVARKAIGTLKTILNEAMHDGYIKCNYACSKFALPHDGKARDNGVVLSSFSEIHGLLDMVDAAATACVQRIAYTGLLQGLRPEERYALDWSCFDLVTETLTVSEARVSASRQHGGVQDKATKTRNSARALPIHPRLLCYLASAPAPHEGAFIKGANGDRVSPSTAQKRWRAFLRDNPECPPVTIENMRHSFATAYLAEGGSIEALSRILGHSNISTTINRYYRPDVNLLRADMDRVARAYGAYGTSPPSRDDLVWTGVRFSAPPPR